MATFFTIICIIGAICSIFNCVERAEERRYGSSLIWGILFFINSIGAITWWHSWYQSEVPDDKQNKYQIVTTKTLITANDTVVVDSHTTYQYTE